MLPALLALSLAQPPDFALGDAGAAAVIRREGDGFAVHAPHSAVALLRGLNSRLWTLQSDYGVAGDFTFATDFEVRAIGPPGGRSPAEANVEIGLEGRGHLGRYGVNVCDDPQNGPTFKVLRAAPNERGYHFHILPFPRRSATGTIAVRREGLALVFLAADGAGAPLRELVRYPFPPEALPNLKVSAYQGTAREPVPLDVRLTRTRLTGGELVRGDPARATPTPPAPPATYPIAVDYGKSPARLLADFSGTNDQAKTFRAEGDAVRVGPPVGPHHKDAATYWFRDTRFSPTGDFEVSFRLAFDRIGPLSPKGIGVAAVGVSLETGGRLGSISLECGLSGGGRRYAVTRYSPTLKNPGPGDTWDTQEFAAGMGPTRLTIRRTGAEVVMLAQEDGQPERVLTRVPFPPGPVQRVRLMAFQGNTPETPIEATVSDFVIRAGNLLDPERLTPLVAEPPALARGDAPTAPVVLTGAPTAAPTRKWALLGIGAGSLIGLGALVTLAAFWRRGAKS